MFVCADTVRHKIKIRSVIQSNSYNQRKRNYGTTKIPSQKIATLSWPHLKGVELADPTFLTPGSVDMLLGVKEYTQIIQEGIIKGPPGTPTCLKTYLGWIIFGEISNNKKDQTYVVFHHHHQPTTVLCWT
jgi:hypothetical protein